jgi:hypothetical protein
MKKLSDPGSGIKHPGSATLNHDNYDGRLLVRNNQADYMRAVLHQLPYYIPPVMFANLINILIFAIMMGAVELLPNLLFTLWGSGKVSKVSKRYFLLPVYI